MELCTSSTPNRLPNLTPFSSSRPTLQCKPSLPMKFNSISRNYPGSRYYSCFSIKATSSDDTSSGANQYVKEEPDVVNYSSIKATTPEDISNEYGTNQYVKEEPESEVTDVEVESEEKSGFGGLGLFQDDGEANDQFPQFDFLNKLNVELDFEDSLSIGLLSVGGIAALWLTASIVGAIDNIPLFPKLMEVVGLGYTIWFTSRYLLFKRNRDELASKIEEIKQQVLGSKS